MNRRQFFKTSATGLALAALGPHFSLADETDDVKFFDGVDDDEGHAVMEQARQRIETLRKGDLHLHLLGADGQPFKDAVEIHLKRHAFLFGAAVSPTFDIRSNDKSYAGRGPGLDAAAELFNLATVTCHWRPTQPMIDGPFDWTGTDEVMSWTKKHGLSARMHALIYMVQDLAPAWYAQVKSTDEWWDLIDRRIKAIAERYGHDYVEYDVINETLWQTAWNRKENPLFPDYGDPKTGIRIFQIARKYLPDGWLMPLDQFLPSAAGGNDPIERYIKYCSELIEGGASLNAIGCQAHFYTDKPSFLEGSSKGGPDTFRMKGIDKGWDDVATLGKPLHITEFNPPSRSSKSKNPHQASLTEDEIAAWSVNFYTLVFSKPYMNEITRWFLVDGVGGHGADAGLVTREGEKKPEYFALRKLLKETWTSDWKGNPDNGQVNFRGFFGDYEVSVPGYKPASFKLEKEGAQDLSLQLEQA